MFSLRLDFGVKKTNLFDFEHVVFSYIKTKHVAFVSLCQRSQEVPHNHIYVYHETGFFY